MERNKMKNHREDKNVLKQSELSLKWIQPKHSLSELYVYVFVFLPGQLPCWSY